MHIFQFLGQVHHWIQVMTLFSQIRRGYFTAGGQILKTLKNDLIFGLPTLKLAGIQIFEFLGQAHH